MNYEFELKDFKRSDNAEYSSWFADPAIEKYLGPAWSDQDLAEFFSEEHGSVLSVFLSKNLVGIVSVALPNGEHNSLGIAGIAVNPKIKRKGVGAGILQALCRHYNTYNDREWIAFVESSTGVAESFLVNCGWEKGELENGMYRYTYKPNPA